jgi:hypothetical protein
MCLKAGPITIFDFFFMRAWNCPLTWTSQELRHVLRSGVVLVALWVIGTHNYASSITEA